MTGDQSVLVSFYPYTPTPQIYRKFNVDLLFPVHHPLIPHTVQTIRGNPAVAKKSFTSHSLFNMMNCQTYELKSKLLSVMLLDLVQILVSCLDPHDTTQNYT